MKIALYPSLMAADQLHLKETIIKLSPLCAGFHLDIMDLHLAPNVALGTHTVNYIAQATQKPLWIHAMVDHPLILLPLLQLNNNDLVSVHLESKDDIKSVIAQIKQMGARPSLALSPETPITQVEPYSDIVDHILCMGVHPGFFGQTFIPTVIEKIHQLKQRYPAITIAVDGGINQHTFEQVTQAGATDVALGSFLFQSDNAENMLRSIG